MGTPKTVATLKPPNTTDTALGASFGSTCLLAATVATAQNTGCKKAGNMRAIINTVKLGDTADRIFDATKASSTRHIINLRFTLDVSSTEKGPVSAMVNAKPLNNQPAVSIDTLKCLAMAGIIPIIPNSVVIMPNAPSAIM